MFRVPRPALSLLVGFVVVLASACSSTATSTAAVAGATGAAGASGAPSSAPSAAANLNDPNSIITSAISGSSTIKSFHIKIEVSGTIKAAALKSEAGSAGKAITSDVTLDGTAIEGDVDLANLAANLTFNVPPMAMLGNAPLTGDLIVKDSVLYYKVSLLGPKYAKLALGSLAAGLPVAIPTPGASAMTSVADELKQLQAAMDQAGVKVTLVGAEQIGGQDANHLNISIPIDKLNAEIATPRHSTCGSTRPTPSWPRSSSRALRPPWATWTSSSRSPTTTPRSRSRRRPRVRSSRPSHNTSHGPAVALPEVRNSEPRATPGFRVSRLPTIGVPASAIDMALSDQQSFETQVPQGGST